MPVYEFRCPNCGAAVTRHWSIHDDTDRDLYNSGAVACTECSHGHLRRRFTFAPAPVMHEHWNHSVGKPVSSMRQFKDDLARASERQSEVTGMEHRYVPVDMSEVKAPE